jgi:hypothetical protein
MVGGNRFEFGGRRIGYGSSSSMASDWDAWTALILIEEDKELFKMDLGAF